MPTETPQNMQNLQAIQALLAQQQQIQEQYNQIVANLKANPNQDANTIASIKSQLDSLNATYLQIQGQLQALGYKNEPNKTGVSKPTEIKSGAKSNFSFKKLAIGGGSLLIIIGVLFALTINALIRNPQSLSGVGIEASMAVQFIKIFAILCFGAFGLIGLGFLLSNIYRIITAKNQAKGKFVIGILIATGILVITGALAGLTFSNIAKINTTPASKFKTPIIPYLIGKDGAKASYGSVTAIAPIEIGFEINQPILSELIAGLGEVKIQSLTIACGNLENQTITNTNGKFDSPCFYAKKGDYPISVTITYTNTITQEQNLKLEQSVATLSIPAEIQLFISTQNKKSANPLGAIQGEINVGQAPVTITVDATEAFRNLGLENYLISRDMDNDNTIDRKDMPIFNYIFKMPKVYHPTFKIPELDEGTFVYSFPLRVEPSDVPICEVQLMQFEGTKYKMQTNILDGNLSSISSYNFQVIDNGTNKIIKNETSTNRDMDFTFPERGAFLVVVNFITIDGKRGSCESEILQLAKETITATYSLKQKLTTDTTFKSLPTNALSGGKLTLKQIPTTLQLSIDSITPNSPAVEKNVYLDGKIILNQGNLYEFTINEDRNHELNILLEDKERGLSNTITLQIVVDRPEIEGKLILSPNGGYEPVKVNLNASQSILNDTDDEIIYFTYDFGDGEIRKNLTQGIIDHTYTYDYENENGTYTPKVTITTRKGKTITFTASPEPNILIRKALVQVDISSPSHPTNIARVNDKVEFLAEFNKLPKTLTRNFGDGSPEVSCKQITCKETTYSFSKAGTYTVKLTLETDEDQTIEKTMTFKVN